MGFFYDMFVVCNSKSVNVSNKSYISNKRRLASLRQEATALAEDCHRAATKGKKCVTDAVLMYEASA